MDNQPLNCLNCGIALEANFCKKCGQKTTTHRFTLKQLISKDFITGFFNLEKGFLYTLKLLFYRPGHLIREYIQGKRKKYFHFLSFLLIILGISVFVGELSSFKFTDITSNTNISNKAASLFENFSKSYPKTIILMQIPIYTLLSYFFFMRAKMNFAEHIVLNTFKASGELVIGIVFTLFIFLNLPKTAINFVFTILITSMVLIYMVLLYYHFFKPYYKSGFKLVVRIIVTSLIAQLTIGILIWVIVVAKFAIEGGDLRTLLPVTN